MENPIQTIEVCGVLINNSETKLSERGPHHRAARKDIREKAEEYGWPVMKSEMFFSRGYPKMAKEEYATHTGNAWGESRKIANEFLEMMGLSPKEG